jgi:hypothetical protein
MSAIIWPGIVSILLAVRNGDAACVHSPHCRPTVMFTKAQMPEAGYREQRLRLQQWLTC